MEDIIIIGAGPIGLYSATLSSLHGLKGKIIESLSYVGGQLTTLYPEKQIIDLAGFNSISAKDFIENLYKQYQSKDNKLDLLLNEKVENIITNNNHYQIVTNKSTYSTKTVVITTGMGSFSPRLIGLENEKEYDNILYSLQNVSEMKDKEVIVLGGGDSAIDLSLLINTVAKKTSIIHRRNDFRGQVSSVEQMEKDDINILKNYSVSKLSKENSISYITITHNETKEEKTLSFDYLLVQYGQIPSKDSFPVEKENNLIKVNSCYETSLPNVFACGNIISYNGKVKNITSGLGEATTIITRIDQIINPNKNIPIHF